MGTNFEEKNIPPVHDFLCIFKTKLLLIKVVLESFSFFKQYVRRIIVILLNKEKEHLIRSKWLTYL